MNLIPTALVIFFVCSCLPTDKCFSQACVQGGTASGPMTYPNASNKATSGFNITGLRINSSSTCLTLNGCSNVTISNCILGPSGYGGLGIDLEGCSNITITNCAFLSNEAGVYANNCSGIKVNNNQFSNLFNPVKGPHGQFVQFNQVSGAGNAIMNNVGENVYGIGNPGDLIDLFKAYGTPASPILISGNEFRNGSDSNQSGGITVGDYGGGYITVENNTLVNTGHFGIGVAGGTNVNVLNNSIYVRPLSNPPPDYYPVVSGIYVWGQEGAACSNINIEGNVVDYEPGEGIGYDGSNQATCDSVTVINNNWNAVLGTGILPARLLCPLLMGYYKFNANWNDASGNGLTATSHGTAYAGQGEDAMCANFDGVQDYLTLTNSPWLEPNSQRITVSCWIKPWKLQGDQGIAQSQDADGYNTGWRMILLDSTFDARIVTSNGPVDVYCGGLTQGAWTQLTMTYDGANLKSYVNGVLRGSAAITGNVAYNGSGSPMMLGNCDGSNYYFDGYMDEFKFYDGNRNDSEILADYNTSYPLVTNPPPEIRAYYSFDGNWLDNSGNGLTAVPSNTTFVCDGDNSSSANFNGSNSSITLPQSPLLDPFSATLSVSCWIKPAVLNGIQGLVQSQNGDGYSSGWRMSLSGSNFNPRVVTNQGPIDLYCPGLVAGVWNYVAMTYDGTSIKGYVNGVLQGSASWGGYIPYNANLAMLMGYCNGSTYYFNGHMDEFKFYDGALTASQIQVDYNNTYSLINATPNCTLLTGGTSTNLFSQESTGISKDTTQNATGTTGYTIMPNPASNEIRISVSSGAQSGQDNFSPLRVELYNTAGQLIKVKTGTAPEMNLIVAELSEGVYYLRIVSPVDMTTKKVMIIR
jgi:parallel beta-helix repeat protein